MDLRHDVALHVHEGVIAQIGPLRGMMGGNEDLPRYGGRGTIVMPGMTNAHHHFGITPLMAGVPFEPLEFWLPQFRMMRPVGARLDTLYSAIEMLESGVTTVHHIASALIGGPDDWDGQADAVIAAYGEAGMRAGWSVMLRDQNILAYDGDDALLAAMPEAARSWFAPRLYPRNGSTAAYLDFHHRLARRHAANPHLRVNYAPANLHWCSDPLLEALGAAARDNGARLHMHLVETERQAIYARERFGCSAVRHLERLGFLGPHTTFGHGNWLEPGDAEILGQCGCTLCHNASSGLRLGSGRADIATALKAGVGFALGIDQSNIADDRDMLLEMKLAWALHRGTTMFGPRVPEAEILRAVTETGAETAGFGGWTGRVECGMRADLVLLDRARVERPFTDPRTPPEALVLHRATKDAVQMVLVDGRPVVKDGKVCLFDRDAVLEEIRVKLTAPPSAAEVEAAAMVSAAMPAIRAHYARYA
ncbi:amidohydrolase family protein [Jiella sp. MQZ9-1]|uniref:Amidohydrolase family protein n=1 Tax=Jiella flava TaxID=2816857 RepID=A0A939G1W9_9HYPH|nr:amidohydrolase family protein [Jiella flava]MBO0664286.1 amidohydrolase family protein [Jiella flava]MCD2472791.1 amidohydrolase family protein [Jiella flava]